MSLTGGVQELLRASAEFRALWDDQKAGGLTRAFKVFVPPEAGFIELTYESFDVRAAPGRDCWWGRRNRAAAARGPSPTSRPWPRPAADSAGPLREGDRRHPLASCSDRQSGREGRCRRGHGSMSTTTFPLAVPSTTDRWASATSARV
ncbi:MULTISPECIES: hypothetical protein [unclassified Streptomyces]|uniref:MmyB family transcriptional regulator n=1 Tax=unclassified Streptomyces TaxID=2593676 RepID=UPI002475B9B8|nr:hypothetical protein [Streptomyces sp. SAI-133]